MEIEHFRHSQQKENDMQALSVACMKWFSTWSRTICNLACTSATEGQSLVLRFFFCSGCMKETSAE
jgi:hypothetical protein